MEINLNFAQYINRRTSIKRLSKALNTNINKQGDYLMEFISEELKLRIKLK